GELRAVAVAAGAVVVQVARLADHLLRDAHAAAVVDGGALEERRAVVGAAGLTFERERLAHVAAVRADRAAEVRDACGLVPARVAELARDVRVFADAVELVAAGGLTAAADAVVRAAVAADLRLVAGADGEVAAVSEARGLARRGPTAG